MKDVFREVKKDVVFYYTKQLDYPAHIHEDIELVYVLDGGGIAFCDGKKYELSKGSFFLAFPNQVHHYTECNHGNYILLVLKPSNLLCHQNLYCTSSPVAAMQTFEGRDDEHTSELLIMALEEYNNNAPDMVIQSYLTAFFEKLLTFYEINQGVSSSDTVLRILQYCAIHFKEDISVSDVAEDLNVSKSTVSHIFGSRLGIGFCEHINSLRLTHALYLLRNRDYSITDISYMSGFPTTRTFNRVFQKQYGISPSAYRKNLDL